MMKHLLQYYTLQANVRVGEDSARVLRGGDTSASDPGDSRCAQRVSRLVGVPHCLHAARYI